MSTTNEYIYEILKKSNLPTKFTSLNYQRVVLKIINLNIKKLNYITLGEEYCLTWNNKYKEILKIYIILSKKRTNKCKLTSFK